MTFDAGKLAFRAWSWPAGQLRTTAPLVLPRKSLLAQCLEARFSPNGKHLVAVLHYSDCPRAGPSGPEQSFVETWDLAAGKLLGRTKWDTQNQPVLLSHHTGLYLLGQDSAIRDAVTGRLLVKLKLPEGRGLGLVGAVGAALAPDGRTVVIGAGFTEQPILLFEARTGRLRGRLPMPANSLTGLSVLPDGRLVSLGITATVWSIALHPAPAADVDPRQEWERLSDPDPEKAYPAMAKLAGTPLQALELIRDRVRPVPKLSATAVERILRNLDADDFKDREAANKELDRLGAAAVPRIKARLEAGAPPEMKKRLEAFLVEHDREDLPADELRSLRCLKSSKRSPRPRPASSWPTWPPASPTPA